MPDGPADQPPRKSATLAFAAVLALALVALLAPSIFDEHALSSADLLAHHSPWKESALAGVEPDGEHSDPVFYFEPWMRFARASLEHGGPPLRNPLSSLGVPFLANSQSALYSPFTLPYYVLEEGVATWVSAFLKLFLAGLGAFLLARRAGCSGIAAGVAGLGFAACGFLVLWLSFPLSSALVPLPWALLGVRLLRDRPIAGMLTLALAIATAVLGGHPECAFHTGAMTAVFFLRELWVDRRRSPPQGLGLLGRFAVGGLAGGLLAAPQMAPFLAYLSQSGALEVRSDPEIRALRMSHPPVIEEWGLVGVSLLALVAAIGLTTWMLRRCLRVEAVTASAASEGVGADHRPASRNRPGEPARAASPVMADGGPAPTPRPSTSTGGLIAASVAAGALLAVFLLLALRAGAWNGAPMLLNPHFHGVSDALPGADRYVGPVNAIELNGGYLGATLLLLALLAPALAREDRRAAIRFRLMAFLACLLVSFDVAPFSQALFQIKPFDVVVNRRLLGEAALLGAWLAADSCDGLRRLRAPTCRSALLLAGTLLVAGLGAWAFHDARDTPVRDGHGPLLESLSRPLGSPCAAIETPRARAAIPGDALSVRGYLVSQEGHDEARVRLTHRETGASVEVSTDLGRSDPTPQDELIRQFPNAARSGFEARLDLAGFPGGDAEMAVLLPASTGDDRPILQYRVRVIRDRGPGRAWWTVPASLAALLVLLGRGGAGAGTRRRRLGLLGLGAVAAVDLGSHTWQHVPQIPRERCYPEFPELAALRTEHGRILPSAGSQETLRPNAHMAYGLAAVEGVDVLGSRRATELVNSVRDQNRDRSPLGNALRVNLQNPAFPLLGVERLLVPAAVPVRADEADVVLEGPALKVLAPKAPAIRAAFYTRWVTREADVPFDEWLGQHGEAPTEVLVFSPEAKAPPCPNDTSSPVAVRLIHDHPDEIQAEVEAGPAGWLLITDLYSPDFVAELDGEGLDVRPGYDHLLAVRLPAREEAATVTLRYEPRSHTLGLRCCLAGVVLLALASVMVHRRRANWAGAGARATPPSS